MTEYKDNYGQKHTGTGCGCGNTAYRMSRTGYNNRTYHGSRITGRGYQNTHSGYPRTGEGCGCDTRTEHQHTRETCGCDTRSEHQRTREGCGCDTRSGHQHTRETCGCDTRTGNERTNGSTECCALMQRLRTLEFAIVDTALYLNAYPDSDCALAYYHKLLEERNCLRKTINEQCGPINIYENTDTDTWEWVKGPWPWQIDAD